MSARKISTKPTRIWLSAAKLAPESVEVAREIIWRSNLYYNALVEIERARHCGYSGHGIHPDADIDRAEYAHHVASGLPMTWPDPLNGPG